LQQQVCPLYYQYPFAVRALVAMNMARVPPHITPEVFERALSLTQIDNTSLKFQDGEGNSLLHGIVRAIGMVLSRIYNQPNKQLISPFCDDKGGFLTYHLQQLLRYIRMACSIPEIRCRWLRLPCHKLQHRSNAFLGDHLRISPPRASYLLDVAE
jgi:hypothetical protein